MHSFVLGLTDLARLPPSRCIPFSAQEAAALDETPKRQGLAHWLVVALALACALAACVLLTVAAMRLRARRLQRYRRTRMNSYTNETQDLPTEEL